MLRGLIVVIPLGVTVYVLQFCYDLTAGYLAPVIRNITGTLPETVIIVVSISLFLGLLFILGIITAATAGRRIIGLFEYAIRRIPFVKAIYGASKQMVEMLSPKDGGGNYEASVLVDFPFPGVKSLGFISGRLTLQDGVEYYRVFVMTTPNPTSGYLEIFPKEFVQASGLSVEEALKAAMSAGILMPARLNDGPMPAREARLPSAGADEAPEVSIPDKPSYWARNMAIIRNRLLSGLLLLVPLASTVVVVRFIFGLTVAKVTPVTEVLLVDRPHWALLGFSVIVFVAGLWLIGIVATAVLGQRLIALGEYLIEKIPMVRVVYSASKQIVGTLARKSAGGASGLEAPVFVEFPYPGVRALGFLVGRVRQADGTELCKVFLPTAPNISVGLFLLYRTEDVFLCGLSVDDAIRMVVSLGILCPDHMTLTPVEGEG
jgi:uncharacterized membrane protein